MELSDRSRLSFYQTIAALHEKHKVYLVQHTVTKQIFVKKVLSVYNARIFQYLKNHPVEHTPRILELVPDGNLLIVIEEYINGRTLQEILDTEGCFSEESALRILEQLCTILKDFHSATPPIIHRDLKPSNIMLSEDRTVTLLDMNAAKFHHIDQKQDTHLIGTHGFAAPEQYGFAGSDTRTDIYSLGVLLNVMLLKVLPQEKTPDGFSGKLITGCTRMEPENRYASVDILLTLIRKHLGIPSYPDRFDNPVLQSYLPPGFRTHSPIRILLAALLYFMIAFVFLNGEFEDNRGLNWFLRILLLIPAYLAVFFSGNYRNIWEKLHYYQHRSRMVRILLIILIDLGLFSIGFFSAMMIEYVLN